MNQERSSLLDLLQLYRESFEAMFPGPGGEPVLQIMALREFARRLLDGGLTPPTHEEVAAYRDLFRAELGKRMDTRHPSASPSTEAHEIALRTFVETRKKAVQSATESPYDPMASFDRCDGGLPCVCKTTGCKKGQCRRRAHPEMYGLL